MSGSGEGRDAALRSPDVAADEVVASGGEEAMSGAAVLAAPLRAAGDADAPAPTSERDRSGGAAASSWRERHAGPAWALRAAAGIGGGCTDYDYVVHGLPAPRVPDTDGRRAPRPRGAPASAPVHQFAALKRFPARALDFAQLAAMLEREGPLGRALLEDFRALRSVRAFEARYVDPERVRAAPAPAIKRTRMPRHLWEELLAKGATRPIAGPRRDGTEVRYTAAARPIPDRKDPSLARMIFPCLQLNDVMVPPRATPTPHIHRFIHAVVGRRWMRTCDFVGYFWTCEVHPTVGRRYFAMARGWEWAATVRGLLGWCWFRFRFRRFCRLLCAPFFVCCFVPPFSEIRPTMLSTTHTEAARHLSLITDDVRYLFEAARNFSAFLLDTSLSRRRFGRRTGDLLAIQSFVKPGDSLSTELLAFFFNSAQREAIKLIRPSVTDVDLDVYFPAPPALAESAQEILQRIEQPLILRALVNRGFRDGPGGRGRRNRRRRASRQPGGAGAQFRAPSAARSPSARSKRA